MQRRKHQQLLGRWLNFTKPDEEVLLSESALEAPSDAASIVANHRRRVRGKVATSSRDGECFDASFSAHEEAVDAWEHPLSTTSPVVSAREAHPQSPGFPSPPRRTASGLSPSKQGNAPLMKGFSPTKSIFPEKVSTLSDSQSSINKKGALNRSTATVTEIAAKSQLETSPGHRHRTPHDDPVSSATSTPGELSPSTASMSSSSKTPVETLTFLMRDIELNESILRDDCSTAVSSPKGHAEKEEGSLSSPPNLAAAAARPVADDELQMSFAVQDLVLLNDDDGPDVEVFKKSQATRKDRRAMPGSALQQSFESSGGGIIEFVATMYPVVRPKCSEKRDGQSCTVASNIGVSGNRHSAQASLTDHDCGRDRPNSTVPGRANLSTLAVGHRHRTASWDDTLDDGKKFRRVDNGATRFYDDCGIAYGIEETPPRCERQYNASMQFEELYGDQCFSRRDLTQDSPHASPRRQRSVSYETESVTCAEDEQENELVRYAIEQSLSESGAVSYQNDFHDASSASTAHNFSIRQLECSQGESLSNHVSFSVSQRGIIGPEDVSTSEDQEREMIEIALERSLQDSRTSQSHTSITSRGGSVSTERTLESADHSLSLGVNTGSTHSRASMGGTSVASKKSSRSNASPKSPQHSTCEPIIGPRQRAAHASHESSLLLTLDDDYDDDENDDALLAPPRVVSASMVAVVAEGRRSRHGWADPGPAHHSHSLPLPPEELSRYPSAGFLPYSPNQNPRHQPSLYSQGPYSSTCSLDGLRRSSSASIDVRGRPAYQWENLESSRGQNPSSITDYHFDTYDPHDDDFCAAEGRRGGEDWIRGPHHHPAPPTTTAIPRGIEVTYRSPNPHPHHYPVRGTAQHFGWDRGRILSFHRDSQLAAAASSPQLQQHADSSSYYEETEEDRITRMEREMVEMVMHRSMTEL